MEPTGVNIIPLPKNKTGIRRSCKTWRRRPGGCRGAPRPQTRGQAETVSQLGAVPDGTLVCSTSSPGTGVPGYPVSPLRGWSNNLFHFFCNPVVAAQTQDAHATAGKVPALPGCQQSRSSSPCLPAVRFRSCADTPRSARSDRSRARQRACPFQDVSN
jgi:hypothetical protein